jgi:hypothetical protein
VAAPSFFNENEFRAYPFTVQENSELPSRLMVDCGFMLNAKSRFENAVHTVSLVSVRREGNYLYFYFYCDAPELANVPLVFSRHILTAEDFETEFVDSGSDGLSESSLSGSYSDSTQYCVEHFWSGFLTTGRATAIASLLPGDGELTYNRVVEPALVQSLAESYVARFAVANADRTRVTPATACGTVESADGVVFVKDACLRGAIAFKAGYNANVRQSSQDNSITLGAAVGDGMGEPCAPTAIFATEEPPEGSQLFEGGLRCNQTLRSINGIGGPLFNFIAGNGAQITAVPEENRIIVDVDMSGLAHCQLSERSESC